MKWELVEKEVLYQGFYRLLRMRIRHTLFQGGVSPLVERELLNRGYAVGVLPYDPLRDKVVLIEQFRIGAIESPRSPWLVEIIAGLIDPGESPQEVAHREAGEEANCTLQQMEQIFSYYSSPGGTDERIILFIARVDTHGIGGIHGLAKEGENIRAHVISAESAFGQVRQGLIDNAMSIIALQWLELNRARLQAIWE